MTTTATRPRSHSVYRKQNGGSNENGNPSLSTLSSHLTSSLESGLISAVDALTKAITSKINENGEEYLSEATEKITGAVAQTVEWSKKHPVKLAIGGAALIAAAGFLVSTMKSHANAAEKEKKKR